MLIAVSWVGKKINGGEEKVGWCRVFQKGEIINMSVGCVFGMYEETERKKNCRCRE